MCGVTTSTLQSPIFHTAPEMRSGHRREDNEVLCVGQCLGFAGFAVTRKFSRRRSNVGAVTD